MEDAPSWFKIPKSESPDIWIHVYQNTNGQTSWSSMDDPVVLLERNLYGHPLAGLLWERQFEKVPLEHGWEKVLNWECFCQPSKRTILISVCGRYQTGRQDTKHGTDMENLHERR